MKKYPVLLNIIPLLAWAVAVAARGETNPPVVPARPAGAAPHPLMKRVHELNERLAEQVSRTAKNEILRQSWGYPDYLPPTSHEQLVRLGQGVEIVTESHAENNVFTQRDYYLHDSKVYAMRVTHHDPCLDGKTKRVAESCFFFDKDAPIYRSGFTARVPLGDIKPDLPKVKTRTKEREAPLPPGLEGWGDKLTARAFDIVRTFRAGVGRYAFGEWDAWLLKNAPPEGSGDFTARDKDWLPAAETLALPVRESASPDGLFSIGWGYEQGPVDWKKLATVELSPGWGAVTFSTKMADGPLTGGLEKDGNFLLNHVTGESLCKLGIYYPGERQRFNHDELLAYWSPTSACVVTVVTAKWLSEFAHIAWVKDGRCDGSYDVLEPLQKAATDAVLKTKHPSAKRLRGEDAGFCFSLWKILLEDDGSFEATVTGEIPKDDAPGGYYEVNIEGAFSPGAKDGPALLKVNKTNVLPPKSND
jgi:hypothetical protein